MLVGDIAAAPFLDLGLGAPPALAHSEPELSVVSKERNEAFRGASEIGDLRWGQEGENAKLDVFWEFREGEGRVSWVLGISHNRFFFQFWENFVLTGNLMAVLVSA